MGIERLCVGLRSTFFPVRWLPLFVGLLAVVEISRRQLAVISGVSGKSDGKFAAASTASFSALIRYILAEMTVLGRFLSTETASKPSKSVKSTILTVLKMTANLPWIFRVDGRCRVPLAAANLPSCRG